MSVVACSPVSTISRDRYDPTNSKVDLAPMLRRFLRLRLLRDLIRGTVRPFSLTLLTVSSAGDCIWRDTHGSARYSRGKCASNGRLSENSMPKKAAPVPLFAEDRNELLLVVQAADQPLDAAQVARLAMTTRL